MKRKSRICVLKLLIWVVVFGGIGIGIGLNASKR
jgi:hypothetical protein